MLTTVSRLPGSAARRPLCTSPLLPLFFLNPGHGLLGDLTGPSCTSELVHVGTRVANVSNGQWMLNKMPENLGDSLINLEPQLLYL